MGVWLRSLAGWAAWVAITLVMGVVTGAVALINGKASFSVSRTWARLLLRAAGVTVEVKGAENADASIPAVYVSNHHSYADVLSIIAFFPVDVLFVYKSTLLVLPGLNLAMLGQGHIMVPRGRPAKALRKLRDEGVARLTEGRSLMIFPSGQRSWDESVGEFKTGAAALAIWAGAPIIPVAISGSVKILPRGNWPMRPGKIIISVAKMIPTAGSAINRRDEIIATARLKVQELKEAAELQLKLKR